MKVLEIERTYSSKGSICGLASPVSIWTSSPWVPYLAFPYFCSSPWRMHVCVQPHFLLNPGSDMPSHAYSLLMIKVHLFSLRWELFSSFSSSVSCHFIASLELLERLWVLAGLIKSLAKSFSKMDALEGISSLQTSLQRST